MSEADFQKINYGVTLSEILDRQCRFSQFIVKPEATG